MRKINVAGKLPREVESLMDSFKGAMVMRINARLSRDGLKIKNVDDSRRRGSDYSTLFLDITIPMGSDSMSIGDTVYAKGDKATVTTEPYELYGGVWVDAVLVEGHRKGETVTLKFQPSHWTQFETIRYEFKVEDELNGKYHTSITPYPSPVRKPLKVVNLKPIGESKDFHKDKRLIDMLIAKVFDELTR